MAFWGVEVKPGKPFAHKFDDLKGRLHISMATLGLGAATVKSILQCNVGNRSPVYLCSLSSGLTESLQLNLEFEEVDEVIFSVIGPQSIHLCGYYLGNGRNTNIEESESYGEDIANTETERSDCSDEDEYEDSFIDDDADPEVYPPSPISNEEGVSREKKLKDTRGTRRRLRRKYQRIESDDDNCFEENTVVNSNKHDQTKTIDEEDNLPISSLCKSKATTTVLSPKMVVSDERKGDTSNKDGEDGGNSYIKLDSKADDVPVDHQALRGAEPLDNLVELCALLADGNVQKQKTKKKEKEKEKEGKHIEAKDACNGQSINHSTVIEAEPKMDNMVQDLPKISEQSHGQACDNYLMLSSRDVELPSDVALPTSEMDPEKSRGTNRKRKEKVPKGSHSEGDNAYCKEFKAPRDEAEPDNVILTFPEEKYQNQKQNDKERGDIGTHDFPNVNQLEDRKIKRRKKKNKSRAITSDMPQSSLEQNIGTLNDGEIIKASQVRTLSNGLVVQELERGKEDGKIAASGRKISVLFTGKLKDNGEVFESNVGHAPYKFRLGKGEVIDGWDVGLEDMRVGEKRRLIIPPSMGFGSEGHGEKIPPNSWLVYDFELVKVH